MPETDIALSADEMALVRRVAKSRGISEADAASLLLSGAIARRMKKRMGKNPARVYPIRGQLK